MFCCGHVFRGERPVLLVVHEEDGDWQFMCGSGDHWNTGDGPDGHYTHVDHLVQRDPTLATISDLPLNREAERASEKGSWLRTRVGGQPD